MNTPKELKAVFRRNPKVKKAFEKLPPSHQKEHTKYIDEAKKDETRLRRADKVAQMITGEKIKTVYKAKTIPQIFGWKPEMKIRVINPPEDYDEIVSNYNFKHLVQNDRDTVNAIHFFVKELKELNRELPKLMKQIEQNGMIWVSWPKKSSKVESDISEGDIRNLALKIGLVDVKVCAVSEIWSGLKLVIPVKDRK